MRSEGDLARRLWFRARHTPLAVPLVAALAVGCSGDDGRGGGNGSGLPPGGPEDDGGGGIPKLDLPDGTGTGNGGEGGPREGCEKIDFLFVIDRSGSMEDEQQNLITSFPEFIDTIRNVTEVTDYQIMVVDTDDCDPNAGAGEVLTCDEVMDPGCCEKNCATFPAATCNGAACGSCAGADPCEDALGGGRTTSKDGAACGIDSGFRYMLESQADLDGTFACVAEVGINGSGNERTMDAMVASISDPMIDAGGCNEAFVRDDALLVIVIITDEEDDPETAANGYPGFGSAGDPQSWYDAVIARKGNPNNAVALALVGPEPPDDCPPLDKVGGNAIDGAEIATRILQFTGLFQFGFVGPVCAPSYKMFFEDAVNVVDEACDVFVPPQG